MSKVFIIFSHSKHSIGKYIIIVSTTTSNQIKSINYYSIDHQFLDGVLLLIMWILAEPLDLK